MAYKIHTNGNICQVLAQSEAHTTTLATHHSWITFFAYGIFVLTTQRIGKLAWGPSKSSHCNKNRLTHLQVAVTGCTNLFQIWNLFQSLSIEVDLKNTSTITFLTSVKLSIHESE